MATTEAKFSVSYAPGKPALITIRGDSAEEAKAAHEAAVSSGLLKVIKEVQDSLNGAAKAAAAGPSALAASPAEAVLAAQQLPAGMAEPPCTECGKPTRFAQEGISA